MTHVPIGGKIPRDWRIRLRVQHNPKQHGSGAYDGFSLYRDGMTVGEFLDSCKQQG